MFFSAIFVVDSNTQAFGEIWFVFYFQEQSINPQFVSRSNMQLSSPIVILKITPRHSGCVKQSTLHSTRDLEIKCSKSHKCVQEFFVRHCVVVIWYVRSRFIKCVYVVFMYFFLWVFTNQQLVFNRMPVNKSLISVSNSSQKLTESHKDPWTERQIFNMSNLLMALRGMIFRKWLTTIRRHLSYSQNM